MLQPLPDVCFIQWWEAEPRAAGLERGDNLADVVANEAEASVTRVLLNYCSACSRRLIAIYIMPCSCHNTHRFLHWFKADCNRCCMLQNTVMHGTSCRRLQQHYRRCTAGLCLQRHFS
eukprot:GHUV01055655.1.p1 GENE.GHUV01055655.1~~GHUV01055655.1.p1  ORF type:complete len:118 (-),score=9.89 GHUV01055655.1:45-398(-)